MKKAYLTVLFLALAAMAGAGQAITISLDPVTQTVGTGSSVQVNLNVAGLGDGAAPSLGTYDIDIAYDDSILSFTSVSFGDSVLGDQLDLFSLGSITSTDNSIPGTVNVFELSFDDAIDLDSLQAPAFTLATLTFFTLTDGISSLGITVNALGDSLGDPLVATLSNASISVSAVPLPAAAWLLGSGLLGLVGLARRSR